MEQISKNMIFTHEIDWDKIKTVKDIKTVLKGLGICVRPGMEGVSVPMEFLKKVELKSPPWPQKKNDTSKK